MRRQFPTTPYDAAAWYILWGIAFAALAGVLLLVSWSAPPRERLQTVSGEFEKADRSCTRRSGCWLEINLRTAAGRLTLRQVEFAAATTALQTLRPGDHITALVAPLTRH